MKLKELLKLLDSVHPETEVLVYHEGIGEDFRIEDVELSEKGPEVRIVVSDM